MSDKLMTVKDVADKLKVPWYRVHYAVTKGHLKAETVLDRIAITRESFAAYQKRKLKMSLLPSVEEYCRSAGITRNMFNGLVKRGKVKTIKIGGRVFVPERGTAK